MKKQSLSEKNLNIPIGLFATEVRTRVSSDCTLPVYSVTKHRGMVPSGDYFNKQVHSRDLNGYKLVEKNQFAYATIHLDEGSLGLLTDAEKVVVSPMYTVFEIDTERVFPPYLYRLLKSPPMMFEYAYLGKGAVHRRKAIPFATLKVLEIHLPPLREQHRIADILSRIDLLREKRKASLALINSLIAATFVKLFGNPLTNPQSHPVMPMKSVAQIARGRFSPRPRNDPRYYGGQFPFIQTGDITRSDLYLREHTQTLNELGFKVSKQFPAGTIVITIVGANIGETAILTYDTCFPDSIIGIQCSEYVVLPEFLRYQLVLLRDEIVKRATTTAQPNINVEMVNSFPVIVPPLQTQQQFVDTLKKLIELSNKMQKQLQQIDDLLKALHQNISEVGAITAINV